MHRKHYLLRRFTLIMILGVLASLLSLFWISTRLVVRSFDAISRIILVRFLDQAEDLAQAYRRGDMTVTALDQAMNPELDTSLGVFMLFDDAGILIASSAGVFDQETLTEAGRLAANLSEEQFVSLVSYGQGRFVNNRMLARPLFLDQQRYGTLFAGINANDLLIERNRFNTNFFLAIWPLFLLIALVSYLMTRHLARPVRVLTDAAQKIGSGRTGIAVESKLPGEMGELAGVFNVMSANLDHTIHSLNYEKNSMALMLEGLKEGIVAMDATGNIIHQNSSALELLGGAESPHYRQVIRTLRRCIDNGEPSEGQLSVADILVAYTVRRIPAGDPVRSGAIASLRDVTASERLEQTRRDYVANISHELRTPLTAMRSLIEPLRDGLVVSDEDRRRCYAMIAAETVRLSRLVNDLLELSGIQSGATSFETETIDIGDLLQDIYYQNLSLFRDAGLDFQLKIPPADLPDVQSNEDRLIEVLTIFLDNARKYTPAGGRIVLSADLNDTAVLVSVSDTGIGMDETTLKYAFDRFYQADQSRSDRGNGLGLAIAREILLRMAIPLQVASSPDKGSAFTLEIPVFEK